MTLCPKCHYKRNKNDYAPEYECPNCGIVYEKYKGEPRKDFNKNGNNEQQSTHNKKQFTLFICYILKYFMTASSFFKNVMKKSLNSVSVHIKTAKKIISQKRFFYIAGACFI